MPVPAAVVSWRAVRLATRRRRRSRAPQRAVGPWRRTLTIGGGLLLLDALARSPLAPRVGAPGLVAMLAIVLAGVAVGVHVGSRGGGRRPRRRRASSGRAVCRTWCALALCLAVVALGDRFIQRAPSAVPGAAAAGTAGVAAVAAGYYHGLVVMADGSVNAWGNADYYALGTTVSGTCGTTPCNTTPRAIAGLTNVVAVAGGDPFSLALKRDGTVWAWGDNSAGQLGAVSTQSCRSGPCSATPVQVTGLSGVTAIAAGRDTGLALKGDGTVWAWGLNTDGGLGVPPTDKCLCSPVPVQITGLRGVTAIAAGLGDHSLALLADGTVWAWGNNRFGQLGVAPGPVCDHDACSRVPVPVPGLSGVTAIGVGEFHSLAVRSDGTVWTWGANQGGQLGDGTPARIDRSAPAQVVGVSGATAVTGGEGYSAARASDGTVWTWGADEFGQLGDGAALATASPCQCSASPLRVNGLTGVTAIAGGDYDLLAVTTAGVAWTWGANFAGQLGNGGADPGPHGTPARVVFPAGDVTLAWGLDRAGELGAPPTDPCTAGGPADCALSPITVAGLGGMRALAAGVEVSLAVAADGGVWAWGDNTSGQLGNPAVPSGRVAGNRSAVPLHVVGPGGVGWLANIVAVATDDTSSLALDRDGTVWRWGQIDGGTIVTTPTRLAGPGGIAAIAANSNGQLLLAVDGTVWANDGAGGTFVPKAGLPASAAIAVGWSHDLAVGTDGSVWAWGRNDYGQLGAPGVLTGKGNPSALSATPVRVVGAGGVGLLGGVKTAMAGDGMSIALKADGTVWTWGWNGDGTLGNGTTTDSGVPVQVANVGGRVFAGSSTLTDVTAISAKAWHVLALRTNGDLVSWGWDYEGEVGSRAVDRTGGCKCATTPVTIGGLPAATTIAAGALHSLVSAVPSAGAPPPTPVVTYAPAALRFDGPAVGSTSPAQRVTLGNGGSAPLTIVGVTIDGDFAQTNDCVPSVVAGASCTIRVTFTPTATGPRSGTLTVTSDAAGGPITVALSGAIQSGPTLSFGATSLAFGTQAVGATSSAQVVTLRNTGTTAATMTSIATDGDFALAGLPGDCPPAPTTLAAGASCTLRVTFTPSVVGARSGTLRVTSDNTTGNSPQVVLTGVGIGPAIVLKPTNLVFAEQAVGSASDGIAITLTNNGGVTANITSLGTTGTNAVDFLISGTGCAGQIAPQGSCQVSVKFAPTRAVRQVAGYDELITERVATLGIAASDGTSIQQEIRGQAVPAPMMYVHGIKTDYRAVGFDPLLIPLEKEFPEPISGGHRIQIFEYYQDKGSVLPSGACVPDRIRGILPRDPGSGLPFPPITGLPQGVAYTGTFCDSQGDFGINTLLLYL